MSLESSELRGFDDLIRTETAGADLDPLDAAVDHRPNDLQIRFEPTRTHIIRVAMLTADDRTLPAHFTSFRHFSSRDNP